MTSAEAAAELASALNQLSNLRVVHCQRGSSIKPATRASLDAALESIAVRIEHIRLAIRTQGLS